MVRLALAQKKGLRPKDLMLQYNVSFRTARKQLQALVRKGLLRPVVNNAYVCYYEPVQGLPDLLL